MTLQDMRATDVFREAESVFEVLRRPGSGLISDAAEIHVAPSGRRAAFTGTIVEKVDGRPSTRICEVDLISGDVHILTAGPHNDFAPHYCPDGHYLAFLSDREQRGRFKLFWRDLSSGEEFAAASPDGSIEYFQWSPDGNRFLLGVAGDAADVAGWQGAREASSNADIPAWMPSVDAGLEPDQWRTAWICERPNGMVGPIPTKNLNLWEAVWCGSTAVAAIASTTPDEGAWYGAKLVLVDIATGSARDLYVPRHQLGFLTCAPLSSRLAVIEAPCSDRGIIAGRLLVVESKDGTVCPVDAGMDVSCIDWRGDELMLVAGHRDFETVVGVATTATYAFTASWRSDVHTTGGRYVMIAGIGSEGDFALVGEHNCCAPEIATVRQGRYQSVASFDMGYAELSRIINGVDQMRWTAPDGLEVQGWLLKPEGKPPYPVIVNIHGGPIWSWRPRWLGRGGGYLLMLLQRGYAIFCPNPRGSTGRGVSYAEMVIGDVGGRDGDDVIAGVDALIANGTADAARLGIMGGSYGGYLTSWLVTQDSRFAAAVSIAPITNLVTHHLNSNIPHFGSLFVSGRFDDLNSAYFSRSPVLRARSVTTPTLNIRGALDRCTPPEEAAQFHNALLQNGVTSCLITYPQEGHGVGKYPAMIDFSARIVEWFERHMPPASATSRRLAEEAA